VICLADHPAELARLRAAPELLPAALEEVLRYRTQVQAMFRTTTREVEIGGRTIPAHRLVLAMIGAPTATDSISRASQIHTSHSATVSTSTSVPRLLFPDIV
jgi:cytochrome P450